MLTDIGGVLRVGRGKTMASPRTDAASPIQASIGGGRGDRGEAGGAGRQMAAAALDLKTPSGADAPMPTDIGGVLRVGRGKTMASPRTDAGDGSFKRLPYQPDPD